MQGKESNAYYGGMQMTVATMEINAQILPKTKIEL